MRLEGKVDVEEYKGAMGYVGGRRRGEGKVKKGVGKGTNMHMEDTAERAVGRNRKEDNVKGVEAPLSPDT